MQMTPDQYADYIADGSKYARDGHRWQFVRDRAKKVIDEIMASKRQTEVKCDHSPDWQNPSICNECGKPMKGAKS